MFKNIRDALSRWILYSLESVRLISLFNAILILDVWRKEYQLSLLLSFFIGILLFILIIGFGYVWVNYFKEDGFRKLYTQIPQINEILERQKKIEKRLDELVKYDN